jgi:hypothetical protein
MYWPKHGEHVETATAFTRVFARMGYKRCRSEELEEGFEKIALYVSIRATLDGPAGTPTHMARQLLNGRWTSKLGDLQDIEHDSVRGVEGPAYGRLFCIMRRQRRKQNRKQ